MSASIMLVAVVALLAVMVHAQRHVLESTNSKVCRVAHCSLDPAAP